jgi:hypothetical protein
MLASFVAVLIAVHAKLYPFRDQLNKAPHEWDTQEVVRFLALINNIRALASTRDTFLEIFEYLNVGHAIPAVGIHSHQCRSLVMQFYMECFMQMGKYPSRYELLRFFICLSATQLCHYTEIAEGTGINVMKIRLKLHELVNNFDQMGTHKNVDLDAQEKACIELLEQADPMMVSLPERHFVASSQLPFPGGRDQFWLLSALGEVTRTGHYDFPIALEFHGHIARYQDFDTTTYRIEIELISVVDRHPQGLVGDVEGVQTLKS